MSLDQESYYNVIEKTQLVSTDIYFVLKDRLLVGKRKNPPAKNWLFTPGCRAFKNETLESTCIRVASEELGISIKFSECKQIGVFDHIYPDNFRDSKFGTHYVNIAYVYQMNSIEKTNIRLDTQHSFFRWIPLDEVLNHKGIHPNVKDSFKAAVKKGLIKIRSGPA